jgi:glycine cleavage system aminomethyltransferase T
MDVVSNSTNAVCLTLGIPANRGQVGMEARANLRVEEGLTVFGAENNVNKNLAE